MEESRVWLVKCGGRIIGPHTNREVEGLIRARELFPLDEITTPQSRWRYLRDEPKFSPVFVILKNKEEFFNGTQTIPDTRGAQTQTLTASSTGEVQSSGEVAGQRPVREVEEKTNGNNSYVVSEKVVHASEPGKNASADREVKVFSSPFDAVAVERVNEASSTKLVWALALLVIAGIVGFNFLARKQTKVETAVAKTFPQLVADGKNSMKVGDFEKARESFVHALEIRTDAEDVVENLIPIMIEKDDIVQAKRHLEKFLKSSNPEQKKWALNMQGLALMKSNDFVKAKDSLDEALKIDSKYPPAKHNLAAVYLNIGKNAEAARLLKDLIAANGEDPTSVLMFAESALRIAKSKSGETGSAALLQEAITAVSKQMMLSYDLRQEFRILRSGLLFATADGSKEKAIKEIGLTLDEDPYLTEEHIRNLNFSADRMKWDNIIRWVSDIVDTTQMEPHVQALLGLAHFNGGDKMDGKRGILDAVEKAPSDPLLLALKGYVSMGAQVESDTSLAIALQNTKDEKVPHILAARACVKRRDWKCAEAQWGAVVKIDPKYPSAVFGLAEVKLKSNDVQAAMAIVRSHMIESANYGPYRRLIIDSESRPK